MGKLILKSKHRVFCGDSRQSICVARAMGGQQAAAVLTDPPYGVDYVGKTKDALVVHNDGAEGLQDLLDLALEHACQYCVAGGAWYVAAPSGPQFLAFGTTLTRLEIWRQTLVWVKNSLVMGHSDFHYQHEMIFYGWKPGGPHNPPPDRSQTSVWNCDRPSASRDHPTMKPVALYQKMIDLSVPKDALIYDPFLGSGTTLIAAETKKRRCIGIELSPSYVDVIVQRWKTLTNGIAIRQSDGERFERVPENGNEASENN